MALSVRIRKKLAKYELDLAFEAGNEVVSLLGPSGCGKSVTLKCIAGVMRPDEGRIVIDGRALFDSEKKICLPPQKRRAGLLFQQYALFPNMTVRQNIAAGVHDREHAEEIVSDIMERFHLTSHAGLRPYQISGGQQQRTALARILVSDPEVILLDEPFSALDSMLKERLIGELEDTLSRFPKTVLLVTHDPEEAYRLAARTIVMDHGRITGSGLQEEMFEPKMTVRLRNKGDHTS